MEELRKNNIYEAEVTGLTSEGAGVCRICGRAVFVPFARYPGERWRIRIVKVTKTAVYGRGEELLSASPDGRAGLPQLQAAAGDAAFCI